MSVGGLTANNVNLFLITNQTPAFDVDPFSGIQGNNSFVVETSTETYRYAGMGATAQGFFAGLVNQGLPCELCQVLATNLIQVIN